MHKIGCWNCTEKHSGCLYLNCGFCSSNTKKNGFGIFRNGDFNVSDQQLPFFFLYDIKMGLFLYPPINNNVQRKRTWKKVGDGTEP